MLSARPGESVSEEEVMRWWSDITYSPEDLIIVVKPPQLDSNFIGDSGDRLVAGFELLNFTAPWSPVSLPGRNLEVAKVSNTFGVCFTIRVPDPVPEHASLIVQVSRGKVGPDQILNF